MSIEGRGDLHQFLLIVFILLDISASWGQSANLHCQKFLNHPQIFEDFKEINEVSKSIKPITSLDDFYEAMTKNLSLLRSHKELFELYRAVKFGNPYSDVNQKNLESILDILGKYPDLEKQLFREQIVFRTIKIYQTPLELQNFISSQIQGFGSFKTNYLRMDTHQKFLKKLLGLDHFSDLRFQNRLNRLVPLKLREQLLKTRSENHIENLTLLFKTIRDFQDRLKKINLRLENNILNTTDPDKTSKFQSFILKNKNTIRRLDQSLVDIIHSSAFF